MIYQTFVVSLCPFPFADDTHLLMSGRESRQMYQPANDDFNAKAELLNSDR